MRGPGRQVTDNRQARIQILGDADQHVNPTNKNEQTRDMAEVIESRKRRARGDAGRDQPRDEDVESLETVEANAIVRPVFLGGQADDCGQDPDNRDVAEQAGGAVTDLTERIG